MVVHVLGVYPESAAEEPCHLVEVLIDDPSSSLDFGAFTQTLDDRPQSDWQVAYDKRLLSKQGSHANSDSATTSLADGGSVRATFWFHYLDFSRPLLTPAGPVPLPPESPRPARLRFLVYEPPC